MAASRRAFVAVALFSMCINVLMLTAPIYMLQVFDRVLASGSLDTLILLSAIAAFAILTWPRSRRFAATCWSRSASG